MTVLFTICSNNYLAQAKTLMDSVRQHHPTFKLVIGLVDRLHMQIDYSIFSSIEIVPVEELGLAAWDHMRDEYDIIELNTSVKPSYFKYLIKRITDVDEIFYFDPDIKIFSPITTLLDLLKENSILLTPHVITPIELDELKPQEHTFLNHGIYNLGFIGIAAKSESGVSMLDWWEQRCLKYCYRDTKNGLFVDQLWINHVPLFYNDAYILKEYAFNMAPWNLHERKIIDEMDNGYRLNDNSILTFYHFSSYDFKEENVLNKPYYNRYSMHSRPDLQPLYKEYQKDLLKNKVADFSSLECAFFPTKNDDDIPELENQTIGFKRIVKSLTPPIIYSAVSRVKKSINAGN